MHITFFLMFNTCQNSRQIASEDEHDRYANAYFITFSCVTSGGKGDDIYG